MITQHDVEQSFVKWMKDFVEVPHPSLGGWSPCPYARQARMSNNILIKPGTDILADSELLLSYDWTKDVVIFWYQEYDTAEFVELVVKANQQLLANNIVVLEDHPDTEEIVSGVKMNFGVCPIIVCQRLDKLTEAAEQLKAKGYYDSWTQEDLDNIVNWRHP